MYPPFIFFKKNNGFIGVMVLFSDEVTTPKVIRRVNDKTYSVLILLCQQVTHNKIII